jgi:hypothetical protein
MSRNFLKQGIAPSWIDRELGEQIRIGAEVRRAEVLGTIRARYQLLWVFQGAERSHPFPLIPISYELPLGCHSGSRGMVRG